MSGWRNRDGLLGKRLEWRERVRNPVGVRAGLSEVEARAGRTFDGRPGLIVNSTASAKYHQLSLSAADSSSTKGATGTKYSTEDWYDTGDHAIIYPVTQLHHVDMASFYMYGVWSDPNQEYGNAISLGFGVCWLNSAGSVLETWGLGQGLVDRFSRRCELYIKAYQSPLPSFSSPPGTVWNNSGPDTILPAGTSGAKLKVVWENGYSRWVSSVLSFDITVDLTLRNEDA